MDVAQSGDIVRDNETAQRVHGHDRLGLSLGYRLASASALTYFAGFALGNAHGGRNAALRFRAENSHRLPTSKQGWYLYHKAKHVYVLSSSIKEGHKLGARLVPWVLLFFGVEEVVDRRRRREDDTHTDFISTTVAGLTVAGAFSVRNRMPLPTAARMAKIGLLGGIAFGLTQDALRSLQGNPPRYIAKLTGSADY